MKILIVEDEFIVANDLRLMLEKAGYTVVGIASGVVQARKLIESKQPDWILIDIILKGALTGIDLARELLTQHIPFLFISANTNQEILEAAKTTNPYGFLVKPFREKDLLVMLDIAFFRHEMETKQQQQAVLQDTGMVGRSAAFANVLDHISKVAHSNTSVLITGESGTGKERVAAAIHRASARSHQPMVTVNCAALPLSLVESELFGYERGAFTGANQQRIGKFEQANGGTVFLDEIGELPLEAQVKLLRVLQQREVERLGGQAIIPIDVRIITATNRNLEKEVAEGRFRLDLYYRLNVFPIEVPPLRERKDDIEPLAYYFLEKFGKTVNRISPAVLRQMKEYPWPGNIRELEHLIERQVLLAEGQEITSIDLRAQPDITPVASSEAIKTMEEMEKEHIIRALKASQGKVSGAGGAAAALGIAAQTLFAKMKKFGIKQTYQ
ncbi:sigma-54-dependent transcriptional regulator [Chitinophaga silvisoli]|uniref:Sigma-54-dependent Fis family transcriptional regulator n=1 Tax=Chitinophaga silvisoli TaxID=2291814 RepID=A0A3E1NTK7_9BACT|nr:sigma-54 dependent transcriptional regulator [Chitinophaga silvisoli]RFM31247.1 sigma-54-dependent Fis family transcriptional regulator [Chitinophaga silvisoli]